tara:strand:+ start:1558 stop:1812 length:255 start_codon:yes stop_codon:yes gene_type:complete
MESVYEAFFFLKYAGGWSFSEAYNLPIGLRTWFVERLLRQLENEKEAMEGGQKGNSGAQTLTAANQPAMPPQLADRLQNKKSGS